MAEIELRAGAKVSLLSTEEYQSGLDKLLEELTNNQAVPTVMHAPPVTATTDASGNLGGGALGNQAVVVYECPVGHQAFVHRIIVDAPTATPASPLTAGWMRFCRNAATLSSTEFFLPVQGDVAPVEADWGSRSAPMLSSGESLVVFGASLGATIQYVFNLQVALWSNTHSGGR